MYQCHKHPNQEMQRGQHPKILCSATVCLLLHQDNCHANFSHCRLVTGRDLERQNILLTCEESSIDSFNPNTILQLHLLSSNPHREPPTSTPHFLWSIFNVKFLILAVGWCEKFYHKNLWMRLPWECLGSLSTCNSCCEKGLRWRQPCPSLLHFALLCNHYGLLFKIKISFKGFNC